MKTFVYRWKIERFFEDCGKIGDFYKSPVFSIQCCDKVTKWYLRVYPLGRHEDSKDYRGYTSLYLHFEGENISRVTIDYELSIVCKHSNLSKQMEAKTFEGPKYWRGWKDFAKQGVIKNRENGALVDGTLTIQCEITFCNQVDMGKFRDSDRLLDNVGKGFEDYEALLESNLFSDVTFNIQGNKMHLHKAILMCRNSVFKAMFEQVEGLRKRQKLMNVVEIKDVAYEVMKEVFRFIYSGKVENIDQIATDLFIAADKYAIPELKALCEKTLYHSLTVDNAIEYLKLTDVCETIHLKTLVIEFIAAHCKEIVKKPGFTDLDKQAMHQIIQLMTEKD